MIKKTTIEEDVLMDKPNKSLTRLESSVQAKEEVGKLEETLDATGQESEEGAVKWVIEENKEQEKTNEDITNNQAEYFDSLSRKGTFTYSSALAKLTYNVLEHHVEWPDKSKYKFFVFYAADRIGLKLYTPKGIFGRGFKITTQQKYDLNAVNTLVMQVENTIEECEAETNNVDKIDTISNQPIVQPKDA
jgi:hypothetical protein